MVVIVVHIMKKQNKKTLFRQYSIVFYSIFIFATVVIDLEGILGVYF